MRKRRLKRACSFHLTHTFGLAAYRPGQKAAAHALLSGRDVLCILPTGAGKSLCWQLPALVHPGLTVVVSPLIALMRDQVQHLNALGIAAASIDSMMDTQEKEQAMADIRDGRVRIVFVAPERLTQPAFRTLCHVVRPWLIVVDEAHCVVQWGEGFRPAYAEIPSFIQSLRTRPVICALTATADKTMQSDVLSALNMRKVRSILLPSQRENLIYTVRTTLDRTGDILRLCGDPSCRTVIFCRTRLRCESLNDILVKHGVNAAYYHAGMSREERLAVQMDFQRGRTAVLCATTAFGMGVDIPDIRRVIHDDLPDQVIDYVQQSGRCGRDGKLAECLVLIEPMMFVRKAAAIRRLKKEHKGGFIGRQIKARRAWQAQKQLLKILLSGGCIPAGFAKAFGTRGKSCGCCSACQKRAKPMRIPYLPGMSVWQIRAWMLRWQRDAIAKQKGVLPKQIASDRAIAEAARALAFRINAHAPEELERMLVYFRNKG